MTTNLFLIKEVLGYGDMYRHLKSCLVQVEIVLKLIIYRLQEVNITELNVDNHDTTRQKELEFIARQAFKAIIFIVVFAILMITIAKLTGA